VTAPRQRGTQPTQWLQPWTMFYYHATLSDKRLKHAAQFVIPPHTSFPHQSPIDWGAWPTRRSNVDRICSDRGLRVDRADCFTGGLLIRSNMRTAGEVRKQLLMWTNSSSSSSSLTTHSRYWSLLYGDDCSKLLCVSGDAWTPTRSTYYTSIGAARSAMLMQPSVRSATESSFPIRSARTVTDDWSTWVGRYRDRSAGSLDRLHDRICHICDRRFQWIEAAQSLDEAGGSVV